jgi:serine protease
MSIVITFLLALFFAYQSVAADPVRVAIIDTGVNLEHKEFKPFLERHPKDGLQAYDFITKKRTTVDEQGHGTNIASILTRDNSDKFKMIPLRFTNGSDSYKDLFRDMTNFNEALKMAIELDVDVINISYTHIIPRPSEEALFKKAQEKKIIIVAAAGNSGEDLDKLDEMHKTYPCSYNLPNIICVGNWDKTKDQKDENTNFGGRVKNFADGNLVIGLGKNSKNLEDSLNIMSGSSQAAAKVSRWIVHQKSKGKTFDEILSLLAATPVLKEIP